VLDDDDRIRASYDQEPDREWQRLERGAQARLEFLVTMHVLARSLPPLDRPRHLLDAGGGPGRYTLALARQGYQVTLLDLSPALLDLARARIAHAESSVQERIVRIIEGSIDDLTGFDDAQFDAVLCLGGPLSHILDPARRRHALRGMCRVLHPDGRLFISVMNRLAGFRSVVQWPHAWAQFLPGLLTGGYTTMGPTALPVYTFLPEEFVHALTEAGLGIQAMYGCQGLGAHLQEDHLLALMADPEKWPIWEQMLLATCGHPNIIGVSNHLLAVTGRTDKDSGNESDPRAPTDEVGET